MSCPESKILMESEMRRYQIQGPCFTLLGAENSRWCPLLCFSYFLFCPGEGWKHNLRNTTVRMEKNREISEPCFEVCFFFFLSSHLMS